ncbi:hypothetical protein [Rhizohabitans arisaemae]|uniref:CdiA C-terminal domain-containing protein n=1 Tax=Rhizohabitans arisaemae TaxID=2720610 RepID=UPI0024B0F203|nr:hypothetical protein [Rhizohabitans arisaemae]
MSLGKVISLLEAAVSGSEQTRRHAANAGEALHEMHTVLIATLHGSTSPEAHEALAFLAVAGKALDDLHTTLHQAEQTLHTYLHHLGTPPPSIGPIPFTPTRPTADIDERGNQKPGRPQSSRIFTKAPLTDEELIPLPTRETQGNRTDDPPPSYESVLTSGRVAPTDNPYKYFKYKPERTIAEHLRDRHKINLRSVDEAQQHITAQNSPDAIHDDTKSTVEMKSINSSNPSKMATRIILATRQSRNVVVDVRPSGMSRERAISGLSEALRKAGQNLNEVLIIGNDFEISWPQ